MTEILYIPLWTWTLSLGLTMGAILGYWVDEYDSEPSASESVEIFLEEYGAEELQDIDPYKFEGVVAKIWEEHGWQVDLNTKSSDGGIDFLAKRDEPLEVSCGVQVKRYGPENKVSRPEVQQYTGLLSRADLDAMVIVTTSGFTTPAERFGDNSSLKLINGFELADMLEAAKE